MRVVLADHRREIRSALRLLLEQQPDGWEVLGEATDLFELAACLKKSCPDVLLLDWELPGMFADRWNPNPERPANMLKKIREICPQMHIVVLSSQPEDCAIARQAGADAIMCKTEPPESLLEKMKTSTSPHVKQ